MTQAELDALMDEKADINIDELDSEELSQKQDENSNDTSFGSIVDGVHSKTYKTSSDIAWPPPPPNDEHKVVHQLDDVTRDSERKAIEQLDRLELINEALYEAEKLVKELEKTTTRNTELFTLLHTHFPQVQTFKQALDLNEETQQKSKSIFEHLQNGQDQVIAAMDAMQYQDIHRQKIERAINVMRALNRYMSSLFESKIDDSKRVGSAVHIDGDLTEDVVSNDDIEALIASLGQKK